MPQTFYIATLGCKVNQYESQAVREAWRAFGLVESPAPEKARLILLNSCAVTAKAVADVRAALRRLHRSAPDAALVVSGCAAEVAAGELSRLPGVRHVLGKNDKPLLLDRTRVFAMLNAPCADPEKETTATAMHSPERQTRPIRGAELFPPFALSGSERSRAVLKIQDGCSHGCTYCIVPLARGRAVSRPWEDSLAEAQRLLKAGFREIVISGVNLRQYRADGAADLTPPDCTQPDHAQPDHAQPDNTQTDDTEPGRAANNDFWRFLRALDGQLSPEWAGRARLRISSLEPGQLTDAALECLAACRMVAPHLHLSLQSGSAAVLRRMGRGHYSPESVPSFLKRLQDLWPLYGLGADLLTGFPGESDAEHEENLAFCRSLPLTYAHVFPYSKRPGTRAATLPGQIAQEVKKHRAAELRNLAEAKKLAFGNRLAAPQTVDAADAADAPRTVQVVFEDRDQGKPGQGGHPAGLRGVNEFYVECLLPGAGPETKAIIPCRPLRMENGKLLVSL